MDETSITEREAQEVGEQLRARRKAHGKSKLVDSSAPLARPLGPPLNPESKIKRKAFGTFKERWLSCAGDLAEGEQLKVVEQGIEIFSLLPKESKYAQHRLRILRQVQSILLKEKSERGEGVQAELAALLKQLQLLDTEVFVSGGGPTGLMTSLLLAKWGVPSVVAEQASELIKHPQAHLINHRSMEVMRAVPGLPEDIWAMVPPLHQWRSFVYCSSMTGEMLGVVDHFPGQQTPRLPALSPEPVVHLSQHKLVPLLWHAAQAHPLITLLPGHEVRSVRGDTRGVHASLATGGGGQRGVRARYAVAADGARGALRRAAGVELQGSRGLQHLINIHFVSPELGRRLRGREGMLYFVFSPSTIAVVVAHNIDEGEFVAQVPYFPPLQSLADFTPEMCAGLVAAAVGDPSLPVELRTVRAWAMSGMVAETYRAGPCCFLAGDAAHVFPPSGAFGMNTGIQDAHNLAWKLAAVLTGRAGEGLLDSYTAERRPVALANMQLSVQNFYEALRIPKLMGLDYHTAMAVNATLSSPALGWLPSALRRSALETSFALGKAVVPALSALRRRDMQALLDGGETLRLQYPKEDLGFVYRGEGAALRVTLNDLRETDAAAQPRPRHSPYAPRLLVGGRLPHAALTGIPRLGWLTQGRPSPTSTIDLPAAAKTPTPLLLLLPPAEAEARDGWLAAAAKLGTGSVLPVVIQMDAGQGDTPDSEGPGRVDDPLVIQLSPETGGWSVDQGVHALLLRPDGHIGAKWGAVSVPEAAAELTQALSAVMRRAF